MSAIASTRYGKVEGEELSRLSVFKGIPFAAPPAGAKRWLAPEKPASWSGTRDARKFGGVAPQLQMMLSALAAMVINDPQSEDCLYLNVWTPAVDGKRRPVMVWVHGGAFAIGSGSQGLYDGSTLARRGDVVVVTVNYRLGPLGFLWALRAHTLPLQFGLTILSNDCLWWPAFTAFLVRAARHSGGWRALLAGR